ncbi:flagellar biosynthesis regulator FlaF [Bradyrhizobium prioriisuperbiae]|uniref:flagellar biosynthesis regulator FlaF n=1 Tax=Bradyrhizobium prioriisuperbiae TaxID=2854389 RepID=UPI0028F005C3|nr:flagellar biosynthesis regulator FlaF [Bradyrhizobium prioritasuperba]
MSNAAAQAYARVATTTASPRDIEAQALLKAANKLQAVVSSEATYEQTTEALMFNRKLWTIFLSDALRDENNPQSIEVRQNIANIGIFVLTQTMALQISPQAEHIKPLIEINRNIAAGLGGRA